MIVLYCNVCSQPIPQDRIKGYGPKWPRVCSDLCKNAYRQLKRDAKNLARLRAKAVASARRNGRARVQEAVEEVTA